MSVLLHFLAFYFPDICHFHICPFIKNFHSICFPAAYDNTHPYTMPSHFFWFFLNFKIKINKCVLFSNDSFFLKSMSWSGETITSACSDIIKLLRSVKGEQKRLGAVLRRSERMDLLLAHTWHYLEMVYFANVTRWLPAIYKNTRNHSDLLDKCPKTS